MKLFKRTSITLTIFIIFVWAILYLWVYYPFGKVNVTDVEKEQTAQLLRSSNIGFDESLLDTPAYSVKSADVEYIAEDKLAYAEKMLGTRLTADDENSYSFGSAKLSFDGDTVTIEDADESLKGINEDNAVSKTKAVLESYELLNTNMTAYVNHDGGDINIVFVPEYKGKRVYNSKIYFSADSSGTYVLEYVPLEFKSNGIMMLPKSPCAALADFAVTGTANGVNISGMTLGYNISEGTLVPAWEIETDDEKKFYIE